MADISRPDPDSSPLWFKDAILYEIHARAFFDSDDDGMGDFRGLTSKLDYLQDLGINCIWLLPFFPSPLRDDGYDISDYNDVHPAYGTLKDFQSFLKQAHRRGIRVLTEVVLNHTSDQHPWFKQSRRAAPGSRWRDFYVWSDTAEKYQDARIIFKDYEASNWTWDPVAKAHYWHRFYAHQPDLNYDNPHVRQAVLDAVDFWLDLGVDGLRLDAVPYLYEREGTNCENLSETHQFLKALRSHVDSKYADRVLLAEANQWPEDAVAYFANGDECHMAFHFPLMTRLFMSLRMEDRFPAMEILQETPPIPPSCQWALFLRNHDELTLEMVTDEERDYMYRAYGHDSRMRINLGIRRRLAPLLENDRRKIELINAILFSLPGTPVIYYGDEIGMGDNIYLGDRNGVRTPMQWSADRNGGFSRANPQRLFLPIIIDPGYHYEAVNVESQQNNPHSLLWWMKHLIEQRKQYRAFGRGTLEFLRPSNRKVLAFYRRYEEETILVVANLSRFPQHVQLDLSESKGMTPVEVFGHAEFPPIADGFYNITLGALGFYWFSLEPRQTRAETISGGPAAEQFPSIVVEDWEHVFRGRALATLLRRMPGFLQTRRWFQGRDRTIRAIEILEQIPIPGSTAIILLGEVQYVDGDPELYVMPGSVASGDALEAVRSKLQDVAVAELEARDGSKGMLYSAVFEPAFCEALLGAIARRRRFRGRVGELVGSHTRALRKVWGESHPDLVPSIQRADRTNSSITFGTRFQLKIYRRIEAGIHPEVEIGAFLTEHGFLHAPAFTGSIEYRAPGVEPTTIAALFQFVPNQGHAWHYTLDSLGQFFENALTRNEPDQPEPDGVHHALELSAIETPQAAHEMIGTYLDAARLMGQRIAEMHLALASDPDVPDFAPEPFTDHYRLALQHSLLGQLGQTAQLLRARLRDLPESEQADAQTVLDQQDPLRSALRKICDTRISSVRIRVHDDLKLNRLLHTENDFVIIGFEGQADRPLSERRIKRCPLRDMAALLASLQAAADAVMDDRVPGVKARPETALALESRASYWFKWVSATLLKGYFEGIGTRLRLAQSDAALQSLLDVYLIERAMDEIRHAIQSKSASIRSPLHTLLGVLRAAPREKN